MDDTFGNAAGGAVDLMAEIIVRQAETLAEMVSQFGPVAEGALRDGRQIGGDKAADWLDVAGKLQAMWLDFQQDQTTRASASADGFGEFGRLMELAGGWLRQMPFADPDTQKRLWGEGFALWETVLGQYGIGPKAVEEQSGDPVLPRSDRRFADPKWREQPFFAVVHQTYLMLADQVMAMADAVEGLDPARKEQLRFATRGVVDAMSPANFPLTNPLVIARAVETNGESLLRGMEHMLADLKRGQLSHTDVKAFRLGENIAVTPGKVVHETPLYQIIQYTPVTEKVLATPLLIFPPWINRFYILDLNPKKSFVRWAVEQGISVFIVSWKSADATMAEVVWDDYIRAQIETIDFVRARLAVPSAHVLGYCVAGTTLAATLAVLARRGEADKVKSATFFTAQVDFAEAGDLKHFIDDAQIDAIGHLAGQGFLDGRYMASAFNLLRGNELIWNYVENNYLMGEDYSAFDLLHWNGDVTNLPWKWHRDYLRDLYRDNRLVEPDSLYADDTPIDLARIETPCYIQAGREDHIAPPESVWKFTRHLNAPWTFVLAASGHIAGVVNPPAAAKYRYWTNTAVPETLEDFANGASEHPGSWWPNWYEWLHAMDSSEVAVKGRRKPGGKGDPVIENAPGRYVAMR